jgi:Kae1-associated kinase Bud32
LLTQLHEQHIVHNDFSFNNLLQTQAGVYVIDFGLATFSKRIEDKGVDLWVFKRSLPPQLKDMVNEYAQWGDPKVIKQLTVIEKRGRYKKG